MAKGRNQNPYMVIKYPLDALQQDTAQSFKANAKHKFVINVDYTCHFHGFDSDCVTIPNSFKLKLTPSGVEPNPG